MLVLRQELVKTQTLMDAVNQDHDKEREHLTAELSDVRHKLQLYVLVLELTLSDLDSDLDAFYLQRQQVYVFGHSDEQFLKVNQGLLVYI